MNCSGQRNDLFWCSSEINKRLTCSRSSNYSLTTIEAKTLPSYSCLLTYIHLHTTLLYYQCIYHTTVNSRFRGERVGIIRVCHCFFSVPSKRTKINQDILWVHVIPLVLCWSGYNIICNINQYTLVCFKRRVLSIIIITSVITCGYRNYEKKHLLRQYRVQ